jgi:PAS domain S-box-containing protein
MLSHNVSLVLLAALAASGVLACTLAVVLLRARAEARRLLAALDVHAQWLEAHAGGLREEAGSGGPFAGELNGGREQRDEAVAQALTEADTARERLQNVLDSTAMTYVTLERDWRLTYVNKPGEQLLGRSSDELVGRRLWDLYPELIGNEIYQRLQRAMARREPVEVEWYNAVVDQSFIVHAYPTREGLALHYEDVTERKRAEELRVRLASIVESSDDAIISMDIDGTVQSWNAGAETLYGYTADEAIGCSLTMLAPDGDAHELTALLRRLRDGVRIEPVETVRRRKDGSTVQVFLTVSPLRDDQGRIIGASNIVRDMSAVREAERAARRAEDVLRFLADAGSSLVSSLDLDATLERVVREAVPFFGDYCVVDLLRDNGELSRVAVAHADPACESNLEMSTELLLAELRPNTFISVPLIARETMLGVITFVYSGSNRQYVDSDVPLAKQIASRAALAIDNARLYREAEEANRAKSDFLAVMSHELRTPLNAIGGYTQLMELGLRGPVTEQQLEDLARIRRSQLHLLAMVNDVLNFVRLEAGHARLDITNVDVSEALSAAIDMVAPQIHARGLTFEQSHARGLRARADREKLQQIVLNLLSNSIKYTEPGGHVLLRSRLVDGAVHIQVRDNGCGIPSEKLETIFEPFVRLDIGLTRTTEGTGLGLSISRDLARTLGGDLVAESELGLGSIFTLTLPESVDPHFEPTAHLELDAAIQ